MVRRAIKAKGSYAVGQPIGRGGEAAIHEVTNHPDLVAKIYHRPPTSEQVEKLEWMLDHPPHDPSMPAHRSIAWPIDLAVAAGGAVVGFVMPRVTNAKPLIEVYNPSRRKKLSGDWSTRRLYRTASNLASAIDAIHAAGYVIGDLNESNVLVNPDALVTIIDTDSFQVIGGGSDGSLRVYPCKVGKPEFTPPELQAKSLANIVRTPEQDRFALGVLVFLLVMEGNHPYRSRWLGTGDPPSLEEAIGKGHYPYQRSGLPISPPETAFDPGDLHPALRGLLFRCFVDGHQRPDRRPTGAEWSRALAEAERDLVRCPGGHLHPRSANACPYCQQAVIRRRATIPSAPPAGAHRPPVSGRPMTVPAPPPQASSQVASPQSAWGLGPAPAASKPAKRSRRWLLWAVPGIGIGGWRLASYLGSSATFGFTDNFGKAEVVGGSGTGSTEVRGGRLLVTMKAPGTRVVEWSRGRTDGQDFSFSAIVADTEGWGAVVLRLAQTEANVTWDFSVNPVEKTWILYRQVGRSDYLAPWAPERSYSRVAGSGLRNVEVRLRDGSPTLLINGSEVATPLRMPMPGIVGPVTVALGAMIDPDLLPAGKPYSFVAEFSQARLEER